MKLEGDYTFNAPKQDVWDALQDPTVLASVMPGCEKLEETGENQYLGVMKIRMGTLSGKFKGQITLTDINAPDNYGMKLKGSGTLGRVDGEGTIRLEADGDDKTTMIYDGNANVSGKIASVGQRLMDRSAKAIVGQSLEGLSKQIEARKEAEETGEPVAEVAPPSQTDFAVGVAKSIISDVVPVEDNQQELLKIGGAILGVFLLIRLLSNWFVESVADRVVEKLETKD